MSKDFVVWLASFLMLAASLILSYFWNRPQKLPTPRVHWEVSTGDLELLIRALNDSSQTRSDAVHICACNRMIGKLLWFSQVLEMKLNVDWSKPA